jgi:hypothetical protein
VELGDPEASFGETTSKPSSARRAKGIYSINKITLS